MSPASPIGVGVIGLGFMGRTHIGAYEAARRAGFDCKVVAACDEREERLAGGGEARGNIETATAASLAWSSIRTTTDPATLLGDDAVHLVSICTPTDSHVDLAISALEAGKHVLVEKPVALRAREVRRLAEAARRASTLCMPAMCMRFWPAWSWLRERMRGADHGAVVSAVFQRIASVPDWAPGFYSEPARSGAALFDLHIHDVDFIHWCFGKPVEVVSAGSERHVTSLYRFEKGPPRVVAEGAWSPVPGFPLRMRALVMFEGAVADYELGRDPELLLMSDGKSEAVPLEPLSGYDGEVRHLLEAIARGRRHLDATIDEAESVTRTLEAERESLASARRVRLESSPSAGC
ncbi:MAG: Gfo/Idh/MocA family protein [Planctomycetota bacterium]